MTYSLYHSVRFAREYDQVVRQGYPIHALAAQTLASFASISPHQVVFDLGAGTGLAAAEALRYQPRQLILLDSSQAMLKVARERLASSEAYVPMGIEYVVGDALRMAELVEPASIDVIISNYAFGLFRNLQRAMRQVSSVLCPGGTIVFDVLPPIGPTTHFLSLTPPARAFHQKLAAILGKYGHQAQHRRLQCLDLQTCQTIASAEGLQVVDTLHTEFVFDLNEAENIWRYGWYFSIPTHPYLRRLPRSAVAEMVETAIMQTRHTQDYQAWLEAGQVLRESYVAAKLKKLAGTIC